MKLLKWCTGVLTSSFLFYMVFWSLDTIVKDRMSQQFDMGYKAGQTDALEGRWQCQKVVTSDGMTNYIKLVVPPQPNTAVKEQK